jgi:hypothetical protein
VEFDYKVVSVDDADNDEMIGALQDMVKISVSDGWRPSGGVSVIYMGGRFFGYQAMTRERVDFTI